jgi:glycosyltransferase A (GT-A) superfamily protein (DUF2064 family)
MGMDTPQITADILAPALGPDAWTDCDAWIGPATDGGFGPWDWHAPSPASCATSSTAATMAMQHERLTSAGLLVRMLPELRDVDTARDAALVAAASPDTHFAKRHAQLTVSRQTEPEP